jgi:hypothetical protein
MKNTLSFFVALAALGSTACGGPILYADLDEPALCKTVQDVPFDGAVPGQDLKLSFDLPVGQYVPVFNTQDAVVNLRLNEVTFTAKKGIQDFNSVSSAGIDVLPQSGSTLPQTTVLSYTQDPNNLPGPTLTISGERQVELIPFLSSDSDRKATLQADMKGKLPPNVWTADVRVCFHTHARFNYAHSVGL